MNPYTTNTQRDAFYEGSSVLIEKADHVRLQYINIAYDLGLYRKTNSIINNLQLYLNVNNVGILWSANKLGIDLDFNVGSGYRIVNPTNFAFGFRKKF